MSFMMQEGLFGMSIFEHMLQNRDYCEAFYSSGISNGPSWDHPQRRRHNSEIGSIS